MNACIDKQSLINLYSTQIEKLQNRKYRNKYLYYPFLKVSGLHPSNTVDFFIQLPPPLPIFCWHIFGTYPIISFKYGTSVHSIC